ncbi:MAG: right-handed parallel beta-helix repeat-containing protein [Armatimonadetes bacterium]|nr:right-handed parallel beta-helix repeat-containing protein [Armatimonadota bacterium]
MWALVTALLLVAVSCAWARTEAIHVYPGTEPALNLAEALSEARAARRSGAMPRVVVHGGQYLLEQPLTLGPEDSGLRLEAARGGEATLYAGRRLTDWQEAGDGLYTCSVPEVARGEWDFRMLTVDGVRAKRARLPENGAFEHLSQFNVPWMSTTGGGWQRKPTEAELTTMVYRPGDLGPWLDVRNAEVTVYHMWDESMVGVKSLDEASHTVTFSSPLGHPPGGFGVHKYVVWNVREGLTAPGQWYLDRTAGKVVYWPLPGQDMARAEVMAPTAESIIVIQGTETDPVRDVTVRGLRLGVTNTPLRSGGFGAEAFAGAVQMVGAENCRLEDLLIFNTGGQGLKAWQTRGLTVTNCEVRNTGACGLKLEGQGWRVIGNHIHHVGEDYPSAIALPTGGQDGLISHNEVHDCTYSGVTFGGQGALVEANEIYRTMLELHDGAAIYITFCQRVTLRGNYVHDITDTGGYGASAYYLDEQAEGCLVEGNLSTGVGWPSHNHMARNNILRGNVWVVRGDAKLTFPRSSGYTLERNIVSATGKITVSNPEAVTTWTGNVLYSGSGQREGVPPDVAAFDPLLESPARGVWRLAAASPALALGLAGVDVSEAGRETGPR